MSLITPDTGLFIWMAIIFGVVFWILAKFGFPVITKAVESRSEHISGLLRSAEDAELRIKRLARQQNDMMIRAKKEQKDVINETVKIKQKIIDSARKSAKQEADRMMRQARSEILAEKERALGEIRGIVAMFSVKVAEKVIRKKLGDEDARMDYVNRVFDEMSDEHNDRDYE